MVYKKPVMKKSELVKMGFSEKWLLKVFYRRNQKVAWKSGTSPNCPIMYDTVELEKIRIAECGR